MPNDIVAAPTYHGKDEEFGDGYECEKAFCPGPGDFYVGEEGTQGDGREAILCRKHAEELGARFVGEQEESKLNERV